MKVTFDKVVLAIPPAALKMIVSRPHWSPQKEMAIRSTHFEALYKMGLRFKYRFWEEISGGLEEDKAPRIFPSVGSCSLRTASMKLALELQVSCLFMHGKQGDKYAPFLFLIMTLVF